MNEHSNSAMRTQTDMPLTPNLGRDEEAEETWWSTSEVVPLPNTEKEHHATIVANLICAAIRLLQKDSSEMSPEQVAIVEAAATLSRSLSESFAGVVTKPAKKKQTPARKRSS